MKKLKYVKLFENFMVKSGDSEVEAISQIITFSLTDISKSDFDHHTWIKKWETDMEIKSDGSDQEVRIKKIGEMKYFLDEFQVYFYYDNVSEEWPFTKYRFGDILNGINKKIGSNEEYKSNLEKIFKLSNITNKHHLENRDQLGEDLIKNIGHFLKRAGYAHHSTTFLIGYGTIQTTEKVAYERFNYYCLVTVDFLYNADESIEFYPSKILLKEGEPGQEEVIGVESGDWCKIERKQWESGLKPGDTDHRGFFKITSVEDTLGILSGNEKNVRKK